jgi:hypothetical protein
MFSIKIIIILSYKYYYFLFINYKTHCPSQQKTYKVVIFAINNEYSKRTFSI